MVKRKSQPLSRPIGRHPENPHYFLYKGKPVVLLTSDHMYGAVINMDFDYDAYLKALSFNGMNFTRIYTGAFIEKDGDFFKGNILGTKCGRQILPWARTDVKGAHRFLGGYKLDLNKWNEDYFKRLKDFISKAETAGIIVDIAFFNGMYNKRWEFQPLYHTNNIQGVGNCAANEVQTLRDPDLAKRHEAYVKKITAEVNEFDNVILDICDEPHVDDCPPKLYNPWLDKLIAAVIHTEKNLPKKHLVMQTIEPYTKLINKDGPGDFSADPRITATAHEYTWGIAHLDYEYEHNKPMVLIETAIYPYQYGKHKLESTRVEAWEFIVGGGAGFMQLSGLYTTFNPAARNTENKKNLNIFKTLKSFINSFNFIKLKKDASFKIINAAKGTFARAISEPGKQYALYIHHSGYAGWRHYETKMGWCYEVIPGNYRETVVFNMPAGTYKAQWLKPETGEIVKTCKFIHNGGNRSLTTPRYPIDIALRIIKD